MIKGTITTEEFKDGTRVYRGECVVRQETVTAGEVMSQQIPEGPAPGFERLTRFWRNSQDAASSRCELEIVDKRIES